ncbi:MAG: glycoside hydrolase family 5 protein [Ruminococcus sp.]|nr:glycoside hydrolase family 5 protein [Ruminococcus sp.]
MKLKRSIAFLLSLSMGVCCFSGCEKSEKKEEIKPMRDVTAKEIVSEMTMGWNLGNTLDAHAAKGLAAETSWGNLKAREDMFKLVKDTGMNVVRVPVTWNGHMDENYKVDKKWMARVREVVDYGINNGLYIILDTHHEDWYYPTEENKEEDIKQLKALWEQIAEEFKGYDEHLLFEGLNEPRLRDTAMEWTAGTPAAQKIINEYEKVFYDTVRKSGGNNDKRCLLLTGYAASPLVSALQAIDIQGIVAKDDKNIIVSVHEYLPYDFANNEAGTDQFDPEKDGPMFESLFMNIESTFLAMDIPVIITEFGALNKDNVDERIECLSYLLRCAKNVGVPCVLWDNGTFFASAQSERFGAMNRDDPVMWREPQLIDALMKIATGKE